MNTTHDIQTEINTTALFHMVEVIHGCYSRNINKNSGELLAQNTDAIHTQVLLHEGRTSVHWYIFTFRTKTPSGYVKRNISLVNLQPYLTLPHIRLNISWVTVLFALTMNASQTTAVTPEYWYDGGE